MAMIIWVAVQELNLHSPYWGCVVIGMMPGFW